MNTLLIIEDDPNISELIKLYAQQEGYRVLVADTGDGGLKMAQQASPSCIVLDMMLPGMDGRSILTELRKTSDVPVLFVTAKSEEMERIVGLELGADDYITKPFSPKELMARIKAILRRTQAGSSEEMKEALHVFDLEILPQKMQVLQKGKKLELSALEFKLLYFLAAHPGQVFTREQLMKQIYDSDHALVFDRTIDGHIKKLRKKLGDKVKTPRYIESVFGVGYSFKEEL